MRNDANTPHQSKAVTQPGDLTAPPYPNRSGSGSDYMIPNTPAPTVHLRTAAVRLVARHGDVRSGTLGHIIGRFARETPTYLVSFGTDGVIEVRGDEIVAYAA